jgi:hypothetical protein
MKTLEGRQQWLVAYFAYFYSEIYVLDTQSAIEHLNESPLAIRSHLHHRRVRYTLFRPFATAISNK